jgi:Transposase and inactivated derivatives
VNGGIPSLLRWAFARLQRRIEDTAQEAALPVESVNAASTGQTCHVCDHFGYRDGDEFRCQTDDCWVSEYHADINAAVNIAERFDPWGESLPLKPAGDDIPRNGRACDSTMTHRETSEEPSQMTLSTFHGSEPSASNSET